MKTATCLGTLTLLWWGELAAEGETWATPGYSACLPFESQWELEPAFSNQAKGILPGLQKPMIHVLGETSSSEEFLMCILTPFL